MAAWIFIAFGLLALASAVYALSHGRLELKLDLLNIPVGFGLLRHERGWRTCGLVLLWIELITLPIALVILPFAGSARVSVGVIDLHDYIKPIVAAVFVAAWLVAFWQYKVLTRPAIRGLFYPPPPQNYSGLAGGEWAVVDDDTPE